LATVELASLRKQTDDGPGPLFVFYVSSIALLVCLIFSIKILLSDHRLIGTFWASGSAIAHNGNPYAKYPLTWHTDLFLHGTGRVTFYDLNLNPPATLPFFQLGSHLSISSLAIGWSIVSAICMIGGVALLLDLERLQRRQIMWMLLAFAVQETLAFGTYYSFLFFLSCVCLRLIRNRKTIAAGIVIGIIVSIKPNLGLWPVMLLISGYKRCGWVSTFVAVAFSLIPLALYEPAIYSLWLHAYSGTPHYIFAADTSIIGIFSRLGHPHTGLIIAIILACLLLLVMAKRRAPEINIAGVAICAGFSAHRWVGLSTPCSLRHSSLLSGDGVHLKQRRLFSWRCQIYPMTLLL
jgi:hypothetical protein